MSKYAPLRNYFKGLSQNSWHTTFSEIERIINAKLPPSSRKYQEWWSNDDSHVVGDSWLQEGWERDDINLVRETVSFKRVIRSKLSSKNIVNVYAAKNVCHMDLQFQWIDLGLLSLDKRQKLFFPKVEQLPAIYRLKLKKDKEFSIYIGETLNISRRFGNYRNPGLSQHTSSRINAVLEEVVRCGGSIGVSVCYEGRIFLPKERKVTFEAKAERVLFEHAALAFETVNKVIVLNK